MLELLFKEEQYLIQDCFFTFFKNFFVLAACKLKAMRFSCEGYFLYLYLAFHLSATILEHSGDQNGFLYFDVVVFDFKEVKLLVTERSISERSVKE